MNILVLNWRDMEHPEAGGAEVHFVEIFGRLVGKGHRVTLLTTRFKGCSQNAVYNGIDILRRGNNFIFNWQAPSIVKKLVRENDYDCVVDDVNKLPFYTHRWVRSIPCGAFFHHLFGKTVFGLTNWPMALYVYVMEKMCVRRYGEIPCCAVSPSTAAELVGAGMDGSKLTIIENGINIDKYRPDESVARDDRLLVFVGRLKKYKRVDNILEAMSVLNREGYAARLAVTGTGDDLPRLKKRAVDLGVGDSVDFVGFVDEERKIDYLRRSAIFVNPSEKEGWGITNIEASACGAPVVANDAPGLRDSVAHNETGLLYRENDVGSLVSSIRKLFDDGELRKRLGGNGVRWAKKFSWDESARKAEEWLQKIAR